MFLPPAPLIFNVTFKIKSYFTVLNRFTKTFFLDFFLDF